MPNPALLEIAQRLQDHVLRPMQSRFIAKEEIIDLMGVALVGGENLFLHGPPGTAKTALVQELARGMQATAFDYLLTRFTEPSELFGPFDIRKLKEGELVTNTEGMLPEAEFIFLDELLNANSAILNSLLLVLNERVFRRGRETRSLPALLVVGASNHLPEEPTLKALFDRFLLRVHCGYVPDASLEGLLQAGWSLEQQRASAAAVPRATVSAAEIRQLQTAVCSVDVSGAVPDLLQLVRRLRAAGFEISDRRAVKYQRLLAASALLSGRLAASPTDLWVLRHTWEREEQREVLAALVNDAVNRSEPTGQDHPQAFGSTNPDPERLGQEINSLAENWETLAPAAAKDRLAALAARVPWVENTTAREALQDTVDALWRR